MHSIAVSHRGIAALVLGSVCLAAVALGGCARGVARPAPEPGPLGRGEGAYLVGEVTPHTLILWARLYLHGPAAAEDITSYEEALRCPTSAWSPSASA